jgi:hexosaminidase
MVHSYEPVPQEMNEAEAHHVLGSQGQLWSEVIMTHGHLEYMAFPRAIALAEVVWSPKTRRDYSAFLDALRQHLVRLDVLDIKYRPLD